jgi:hypothetical protein
MLRREYWRFPIQPHRRRVNASKCSGGSGRTAKPIRPARNVVRQLSESSRSVDQARSHPYPGPIDLCPPPYFKLDPKDGCVEVRRDRR